MMSKEEFNEKCRLRIDEMIRRDPSTEEVVASLRRRGRDDGKICVCFAKHMADLGMDDVRTDD